MTKTLGGWRVLEAGPRRHAPVDVAGRGLGAGVAGRRVGGRPPAPHLRRRVRALPARRGGRARCCSSRAPSSSARSSCRSRSRRSARPPTSATARAACSRCSSASCSASSSASPRSAAARSSAWPHPPLQALAAPRRGHRRLPRRGAAVDGRHRPLVRRQRRLRADGDDPPRLAAGRLDRHRPARQGAGRRAAADARRRTPRGVARRAVEGRRRRPARRPHRPAALPRHRRLRAAPLPHR